MTSDNTEQCAERHECTELRHEFDCHENELIHLEHIRYLFGAIRWVLSLSILGIVVSVVAYLFIRERISVFIYYFIPFLIFLLGILFSIQRFIAWNNDLKTKLHEKPISNFRCLSVITYKGMSAYSRKADSFTLLFECEWNQVLCLFCAMGVCVIVLRNWHTAVLSRHFIPKPSECESHRTIRRYFNPSYWIRRLILRLSRLFLLGVVVVVCCGLVLSLAYLLLFVLGAHLLPVLMNWVLAACAA